MSAVTHDVFSWGSWRNTGRREAMKLSKSHGLTTLSQRQAGRRMDSRAPQKETPRTQPWLGHCVQKPLWESLPVSAGCVVAVSVMNTGRDHESAS